MKKSYAIKNEFFIGDMGEPLFKYINSSLIKDSMKGVFTVDTIGDTLSIDEFTFTVKYFSTCIQVYKPTNAEIYRDVNGLGYAVDWWYDTPEKDYLKNVPYGTPVWWFVGGSFFAKGYIKSIERIATHAWKIICQSGIGLLDAQYHVGGMYSGVKFPVILASIIGDTFTYKVASSLKKMLVYGHLPYATKRSNLHTLLFAAGAVITKRNESEDYDVKFLPVNETVVPRNRVSINGSVRVQDAANQAEITEHAFLALQADQQETLFDNTSGTGNADHTKVVFKEPMHDLVASENLTINESNCNYAILSGTGTLTGKRYTHVERIITISNAEEGDVVRSKSVSGNQLISAANSLNTARRILSYYGGARTLKSKMKLDGEKPGMCLAINDAFGEPTTAYLKKADVLVTSVKGADCELVEGYVPTWGGNNYTHRALVTSSGPWTVPAGVTAVRIILIGGGDGGNGGAKGERGYGRFSGTATDPETGRSYSHDSSDGDFYEYLNPAPPPSEGAGRYEFGLYYTAQKVAKGGAPGDPGASGKIFVIDIETVGGETITVSVGAGGNGGAKNGGVGSAGGETTATLTIDGETVVYSSADGARSEVGFVDALGNAVYARPGELGHKGGDGGTTDVRMLSGATGDDGNAGMSVGQYAGGNGGKGLRSLIGWVFDQYDKGSGGGGGGAAWGANGKDGGDATYEKDYYRMTTGSGGDGADAVAPSQPTYGNGGGGGNGGGAGGNVGGGIVYGNDMLSAFDPPRLILNFKGSGSVSGYQHGGTAGNGSKGGKGGNGCGIFYY